MALDELELRAAESGDANLQTGVSVLSDDQKALPTSPCLIGPPGP